MSDLELKIRLTADNSGLTGKVKVSREEVDRFSRASLGAGQAATQGAQGMREMSQQSDALANTVRRAHVYLLGFLGVQGFRSFLDNTIKQEQAMAQLEAVTRSTGMAAGFTAGEMAKQAAALQKITTYGDETVMQMQTVLATFTRVRGDQFVAAQRGILDMATALRMDLQSAAIQVGKALNDPIQGITALNRAGVQLSDSQRALVKELVETGHVAEAQRLILAELETQFGGSAQAARDTLGGALSALRNAIGDLFEMSDRTTKPLASLVETMTEMVEAGHVVTTIQVLSVAMAAKLTPAVMAATQAKLANIQATLAMPPAIVRAAQAESARTSGLLMQTKAELAAAQAAKVHGLVLMELRARVVMAQTAHKQSVDALGASLRATAGATGKLATAGRGLLAAVGGVPGLVVGGVAALGMWAMSSRDAADATGDWRDSIDLLTGSMDTLRAKQLTTEIDAMAARIAEQERVVLRLHEQLRIDPYASVKGTRIHAQTTDNLMAQQQELDDMRAAMERLRAAMAGLKVEASTGTVTPDVDVSAVQDYLDKMRERIDLVGQSETVLAQHRASQELEAAAAKAAADGNTTLADAYRAAIPEAQRLAAELQRKAQADADAAREQAQFEQSLGQLMARLDPVAAATEAYMTNVALLDRAWMEGLISGEAHLALMQQLASGQTTAADIAAQLASEYDTLLSTIDPLHAKFVEMADLEFKAWELFDKGQIKDMNELAAVLDKIRKKGEDAGNDVGKGMTTAADMAYTFASAVKDSAASMRDMYAEGSSAYSGLTMVMQAMNVVMGIAAVVKQYSEGDPYTAFARGAAMIASVAALGISVGGSDSSGPSGNRGLSSNFGSRDGGMLGGGESESVSGALDAIADNTGDLVNINRGMLTALQALSSDLDGMTNQIARTFGDTVAQSAIPGWLMRAGLTLGGTLGEAQIGGFARSFERRDDELRVTNTDTEFALDEASARSIAAALASMRQGLLEGATTLGLDPQMMGIAIDAAQIDPVRLRLDNKDPEKQAEAIAAAFDGVFDSLVAQTLPELEQLQVVGEGLGETLARVSTAVDLTREAVRSLGLQLSATASGDVMAASVRMAELMGGADEYANAIASLADNYLSETEQLAAAGGQLHQAFAAMGQALPRNREGYLALVQAQDMATEAGARQAAQLLQLQETADDYYSRLEDGIAAIVAGDSSVSEAYRAQRMEVEQLIAMYDGSAWAADNLTTAYAVQQDMAYMLAEAWQQVAQRAQTMLGNLAEQIRQDLMGEQELYDYRRAQAHTLADALQTMTDPAQVAATVEEIERLTGQMWQSLAADQREAMGQEFLSFLDGVDAQVQQRMGDALAGLDAEGDSIAQAIDQAMSEAANRLADSSRKFSESASLFQGAVASMAQVVSVMQSAASTMQAAANTPVRVSVTRQYSEVG